MMGCSLRGERLFLLPARRGAQPSRWGQAVSWRLCRLETAGALWVLRRLTDGAYPLRVKPLFLLWESGMFLLCVGFCLPSGGHSPAVGGYAALRMGRTPCG